MIAAISIILAVLSPLESANDYHFVRPREAYVSGHVLGDEAAGGSIRMEDLAFLTEAIQERKHYANENDTSNSWITASSSTNLSYNHLTITKGDLPRISELDLTTKFIPPGSELATQPRLLYRTDSDGSSVTNINQEYTESYPVFETSLWTNYWRTVNTISQVMTNGTVDVFTNAYPGYIDSFDNYGLSNVWHTTVSTGRLEVIDFAFANRRPSWKESMATNDWLARPSSLRNWYSLKPIRDGYKLIRAAHVSYASANLFGELPGCEIDRHREVVSGGNSDTTVTNYWTYDAGISASKREQLTDSDAILTWTLNDGSQTNSHYTSTDHYSLREISKGQLRLRFHVPASVDTMWCPRGRLQSANGFALVTIYRSDSTLTSYTRTDTNGISIATDRIQRAQVMVPLGELTKHVSNDVIYLESPTRAETVISQAISCSGIDDIEYLELPTLPNQPADVETYDRGDGTSERGVSRSAYEYLEAGVSKFYIIYKFKPLTVLDGWSEYEE